MDAAPVPSGVANKPLDGKLLRDARAFIDGKLLTRTRAIPVVRF
jgi:hypothetical protein